MVCERYGNHKGVVECGRISLDRYIVRATCRGEGRGRGERGEGERKGGGGERGREKGRGRGESERGMK